MENRVKWHGMDYVHDFLNRLHSASHVKLVKMDWNVNYSYNRSKGIPSGPQLVHQGGNKIFYGKVYDLLNGLLYFTNS